jgi:putative transcriptional regulator
VSLHHPYDDTMARYAAGRLGAGPALVVATHLHGCRECRARIGVFEAVGGALLEEAPAVAVRPELFAATLRRIEATVEEAPRPTPRPTSPLDGIKMPPWRGVGGGFQWRRLTLPYAPDANVIMLKVQPGQKMPQHTHDGVEYTQILQGGFTDDFGHYMAGDCIEADDEVEHQSVVDSGVECICLAAFDGKLKLQGFVGRMIQPWLGL